MFQPVTQKTLVWLASYPKSGNTWLRAFLGNYLFNVDGPLPLEALKKISSGDSSVPHYQELVGPGLSRLTSKQLAKTRTTVLRRIAGQGEVNLVKTHNANTKVEGIPLIPADVTKLALYVIRDPLDMLVSYADHFGIDPEKAADAICSKSNRVPASAKTVPQLLGDWSGHVKGWTRAKGFRVAPLRYEDMRADPEATFAKAIKAMGAPVLPEQIERAISYASFESLSAMEAADGFEERSPNQQKFFREGRSGHGRDVLPAAVVDRVIAAHGETMKRFGYL